MNIADDLVKTYNDGYQQGKKDAVVRGEWVEDSVYGDKIACSNCRCEANCTGRFEEKIDYDWAKNLISNGYVEIREYTKTNFCPNCGAKMEDKSCG